MTISKTTALAAKKSWTRAARLAELTGHPKATDCRSFLAKSPLATLLDGPGDKRRNDIRTLCEDFNHWLKDKNTRQLLRASSCMREVNGYANSEQHPKPPRAGAPTKRKYRRRHQTQISYEILQSLRQIQRDHNITPINLNRNPP